MEHERRMFPRGVKATFGSGQPQHDGFFTYCVGCRWQSTDASSKQASDAWAEHLLDALTKEDDENFNDPVQ